jgi:hypothetical protein
MSIARLLEIELNHAAARGASGDNALELAVPAGRVKCRIESVDSIGCSLREVQWVPDAPPSAVQLHTMADWLCGQVKYLVEPLRIIETDPKGAQFQVRSSPPTQESQATSYYEALVSAEGISLCRYSAPSGSSRQRIPMHLTREILARLVTDLAECPQHAEPARRGKRV